jgi:hypothetical protein
MPLTLFAARKRLGRGSDSSSGRESKHRYSCRRNRNYSLTYRIFTPNTRGRRHMKSEKCGTKSKSLDVGDPVEAPGLVRMGRTNEALMGVEELEDLVVATKGDILAVVVTTTSNDLLYLPSRRLHSSILCRYLVPII